MKHLIILSLTLLLSCIPQENQTAQAGTAAAADNIDTLEAPVVISTTTPHNLLDSIHGQMELTSQQLAAYFQLDTVHKARSSEGISANPLGDSLIIIVLGYGDNSNCAMASIFIMNRFTLHKVNQMEVRTQCELDFQSQDMVDFRFTDNQNFVVTTDTYDKKIDTEEAASTRREFWMITQDGQFKKSRPDEVETPA